MKDLIRHHTSNAGEDIVQNETPQVISNNTPNSPSSLKSSSSSSCNTNETFPTPIKFLNIIKLHPGVTRLNFLSLLLAACLQISLFVFLNSSQGFVLTGILHVNKAKLGTVASSLTFYDHLITIPFTYIWALISEKVGRRPIYLCGFSLMGLGIILFPHAENVYPSLLLFRILFSIGGAASSGMLTAVLADYGQDEDRGKASSIVGVFSGLGAIIALFLFLRLPTFFTGRLSHEKPALILTYAIVGGISILCGLILFFALKTKDLLLNRLPHFPSNDSLISSQSIHSTISSPQQNVSISTNPTVRFIHHPKETHDFGKNNYSGSSSSTSYISSAEISSPQHCTHSTSMASSRETGISIDPRTCEHLLPIDSSIHAKKSFWALAKEGVLAAKIPHILLAYLGGLLARGDAVTITGFLPLWINKYYIEMELCPKTSPSNPNYKKLCRDAYLLSSSLSGVCQTLSLVAAPVFGLLSDAFHTPTILLYASIISFIGYFGIFLLHSPTQSLVWLLVSIVGIGEIGMLISSLSLVTTSSVSASLELTDKTYESSSITLPSHLSRGSIAGMYSVCGSIGILIITLVGGYLFDEWNSVGPFFFLAMGHIVFTLITLFILWKDAYGSKKLGLPGIFQRKQKLHL